MFCTDEGAKFERDPRTLWLKDPCKVRDGIGLHSCTCLRRQLSSSRRKVKLQSGLKNRKKRNRLRSQNLVAAGNHGGKVPNKPASLGLTEKLLNLHQTTQGE
eukprot:scaffold156777_cov21-Tisochrysis_lutea.AAC.3